MMKKCILLVAGLLSMAATTSVFAFDGRPIDVSELPATARQFIEAHFADAKISHVSVDGKLLDKEYEVLFADGRRIEFAKNGEWEEVDAKRAEVPMSVLPQSVRSYLRQNYPDVPVSKVERDRHGCEVTLRNGLELDFDKNGRLLKVDD